MARKREDKSKQEAGNETCKKQSTNNPSQDKNYDSIKHQLSAMGLTLREIPGDGNCLFGALADQLDGTFKTHMKHRQAVVSYMRNHREDFEPFVEDDVPFERHLSNLAELGTYGGNECIVAFARLQKVKVVIHQLNTPLWQIDGSNDKDNLRELHISYHNGDHYNSVRRLGDCSSTPPKIKLTVQESSGEPQRKKNVSKGTKAEGFNCHCEGYNNSAVREQIPVEDSLVEPFTELELEVIKRTGCEDIESVREFLEENDYHIHNTTDALLNFIMHGHKGEAPHTNGLWGPDGTGNRILGQENVHQNCFQHEGSSSASKELLQAKLKQPHLSNSKRKELKKQLRKQQNQETKRQQYKQKMYTDDSWENSEENSEVIIVKDIGCLSI